MNDNVIQLINPPFEFRLADKTYTVRKANIEQAVRFHARLIEYAKKEDIASDLKLAAFAIYLILSKVDTAITEDYVLENVPGDINVADILLTLGFMTPQSVEAVANTQKIVMEKLSSANSLHSSQNEQDGRPDKSQI